MFDEGSTEHWTEVVRKNTTGEATNIEDVWPYSDHVSCSLAQDR